MHGRLVDAPAREQREPELGVRAEVVGIEPERGQALADRVVEAMLLPVHVAEVEAQVGGVVPPRRRLELRDRLVEAAHLGERHTQIGARAGEVGIQAQRLAFAAKLIGVALGFNLAGVALFVAGRRRQRVAATIQ